MYTNIDILKDDVKYGKFDQIIDLLFCISSVIFSFPCNKVSACTIPHSCHKASGTPGRP